MKKLSLRPYPGNLYVASTTKTYERAHVRLFETPYPLSRGTNGQFSASANVDGIWTYLVWGKNSVSLVHELAHVVLHVFDRCGIDPRGCDGEPFCYMLDQLVSEV